MGCGAACMLGPMTRSSGRGRGDGAAGVRVPLPLLPQGLLVGARSLALGCGTLPTVLLAVLPWRTFMGSDNGPVSERLMLSCGSWLESLLQGSGIVTAVEVWGAAVGRDPGTWYHGSGMRVG